MKTILNWFIGVLILGAMIQACESCTGQTIPKSDSASSSTSDSGNEPTVTASDHYVLDAGSVQECENYLKGRTFRGGDATLKFGYDGTVSAYAANGNLVFAGTLEVGGMKSAVSRWVYAYDIGGAGKLELLLGADGKMMETSSLVMYKPI